MADRQIRIEHGDCREVVRTLESASVHSCVTDPPYSLVSIADRFGSASRDDDTRTSERARSRADAYARASTGFMGQKWDTGEVVHDPAFWAEVLRVLRPGAHLVAFAGTRTYHRMVCAIEDAGFEIRDGLCWLYATGFPKSHDVAKGIDRAAGKEGEYGDAKSAAHQGWIARGGRMRGDANEEGWQRPWMDDPEQVGNAARLYLPATDEARQWQGCVASFLTLTA